MARRGWLEDGPGPTARRGRDAFVAVEWDTILDRLGDELKRVLAEHGPEAIYGGSYGWASAGRFHHAQSQVHRFLNAIGGYVRSVNSYSAGAATVIIPHVLGPFDEIYLNAVRWAEVEQHADLVVAFGGMAVKNAMISGGGISRHEVHGHLRNARERGTRFVLFSPLRDDLPADVEAEWQPIRPGTDTALMLGLAHTLIADGLHDTAIPRSAIARASRSCAPTSWARRTASRRTRIGPRRSPTSARTPSPTWRAGWRPAAR